MANKKIVNSKNGRAYQIRQRTTKNEKKGQIMGLYKKKAADRTIKSFGAVIRRLANE